MLEGLRLRLQQLSNRSWLILVGAGSFLLLLPALAPAYLIFAVAPTGMLAGSGISGTLWNGRAERIFVNGFALNNTRWQLQPTALLTGNLNMDVVTNWSGGDFEGTVGAGLGGTLSVSNAMLFASMDQLTGNTGVPLSGQMSLSVDEATVKDGWPTRLIASLNVRGLMALQPGSNAMAMVGDYAVNFANPDITPEQPLTGEISDTEGPLAVSGTIVLEPPNQYALDTQIKPRANAPQTVTQGLNFMAPADRDGTHNFKLKGGF